MLGSFRTRRVLVMRASSRNEIDGFGLFLRTTGCLDAPSTAPRPRGLRRGCQQQFRTMVNPGSLFTWCCAHSLSLLGPDSAAESPPTPRSLRHPPLDRGLLIGAQQRQETCPLSSPSSRPSLYPLPPAHHVVIVRVSVVCGLARGIRLCCVSDVLQPQACSDARFSLLRWTQHCCSRKGKYSSTKCNSRKNRNLRS